MDCNPNTHSGSRMKRGPKERLIEHKRYHSCDSGVLSDMDMNRNTLSCESGHQRLGSWSSLNYTFSDSAPSSTKDYSTGSSCRSLGTFPSFPGTPEEIKLSEATLPELSKLPWTEADVLSALQKGQLQKYAGNFSIECIQRLTYLLQRPLIRIARESRRLSSTFNKCSKHEVQFACKIVLSTYMYTECHKLGSQATILYSLANRNMNASKSSQCSLTLSVGKHHRWLTEACTAGYVHELASVYLAAVMECIVEQTASLAISKENLECPVITTDMLEAGIQQSVHLHSLYHPFNHLLAGRDFTDAPRPPSLNLGNSTRAKINPSVHKTIENNIISTCVSSIKELADITSQAMRHWYTEVYGDQGLVWSNRALHTLYYYMKCAQQDCSCEESYSVIDLTPERSYVSRPPLTEWIRTTTAFSEHRKDKIIDSDDVMQAARVLLPHNDCPTRFNQYSVSITNAPITKHMSINDLQQELFMAICRESPELLHQSPTLFDKADINRTDSQGLTALMYASLNGEESTVQSLLLAGAHPDMAVYSNHPTCPGWTALNFAAIQGNFNIVQILLENGCRADAELYKTDNHFDTPLQLAAACGHLDVVTALLKRNVNPHQSTILQPNFEDSNTTNAFKIAASHGQRDVLRRLVSASLQVKSNQMLTLPEILDEVSGNQKMTSLSVYNQQHTESEQSHDHENEYMVIESDYISIEELRWTDSRMAKLKSKLQIFQFTMLQDAFFVAAENGYLDLTMEIYSAGLSWTVYTWYMSLQTAHLTHRKTVIQSLLNDFCTLNYLDNINLFGNECLPLMFDIFRESKNEIVSKKLASILSQLYGCQPLPVLKDIRTHPTPVIGSNYLNSRELADVAFVVERKTFYAHKIILVSASNRFKTMLSSFTDCPMPEIEISDIDYQTFESVMRYLYGGVDNAKVESMEHKSVRNLLGAAHYFQLDGLKRKCEIVLSKSLTEENCVSVYKAAKIYTSNDLMEICEAYFLQHLNSLLKNSDVFKRVLYSSKIHNRELLNRLCSALMERLSKKSKDKQHSPPLPR